MMIVVIFPIQASILNVRFQYFVKSFLYAPIELYIIIFFSGDMGNDKSDEIGPFGSANEDIFGAGEDDVDIKHGHLTAFEVHVGYSL